MKRTLLKNKITTFGVFTTSINWTAASLFNDTDNLKISVATNNLVTLNDASASA